MHWLHVVVLELLTSCTYHVFAKGIQGSEAKETNNLTEHEQEQHG